MKIKWNEITKAFQDMKVETESLKIQAKMKLEMKSPGTKTKIWDQSHQRIKYMEERIPNIEYNEKRNK